MDEQKLTKREEYILKKEKKEKERFLEQRQKRIKKIVAVSLISLLVILVIGGITFGIVSYISKEKGENNQGTAKIEINPKEYDAGTVSMADGLVKKTYELKNIGQGDLKISNIKTSCMCTTTRLKVGEKESPEFGMHNNPAFWSQKIGSGETGYLEVVFDPAFHGSQGTGLMIREVYFSTNDSENKKVVVKLLINVIP